MVEPSAPPHPQPTVPATTATICPYLLADGGAWRASSATRAHRCAAVAPPAILAADKQRRLCLTADHGACATFVAARSLRAAPERSSGTRPERSTARTFARTTPLVLDHGRLVLGAKTAGSLRLDRSIGQAVLIVLMVIAFAAILVARLTGGEPGSAGVAGATGTPGASATSAARSPDPTPGDSDAEPSASTTPGPSDAEVSAAPTTDPTGIPAGDSTYVIQSGDTLSGIAAEFGTTWQVLAELNGVEDPGRLRVGQELQLP